jgi:hypothetical protein
MTRGSAVVLMQTKDFFIDADYPNYSECYYAKCDPEGNVYIQNIGGDDPAHTDVWLAKYTPSGIPDAEWAVPVDFNADGSDIFGDYYVAVTQTGGGGGYGMGLQAHKIRCSDGSTVWKVDYLPIGTPGYHSSRGVAFQANGDVWVTWSTTVGGFGATYYNYAGVLDGATGALTNSRLIASSIGGPFGYGVEPNAARTAAFYHTANAPILKLDASLNDVTPWAAPVAHQTPLWGWGHTSDGGLIEWKYTQPSTYTRHCEVTKYTATGNVAWVTPSEVYNCTPDGTDFVPTMDGKVYLYGFDYDEYLGNAPYGEGFLFGYLLILDEATGAFISGQRINDLLIPTRYPGSPVDDGSYLDTYGCAAANGYVWLCGASYDNYNELLLNLTYGDQGYVTLLGQRSGPIATGRRSR